MKKKKLLIIIGIISAVILVLLTACPGVEPPVEEQKQEVKQEQTSFQLPESIKIIAGERTTVNLNKDDDVYYSFDTKADQNYLFYTDPANIRATCTIGWFINEEWFEYENYSIRDFKDIKAFSFETDLTLYIRFQCTYTGSFEFQFQPFTELQVPTSINAKNNYEIDNCIEIEWETVPLIEKYRIYRSTDDLNYEEIKTRPYHADFTVDEDIIPNQTYYYKVTTCIDDFESEMSEKAEFVLSLSKYRPKPTSVSEDKTEISISWDKVEWADGYRLYRRDQLQGSYNDPIQIGGDFPPNITEYIDNDPSLILEEEYYYAIGILLDGEETIYQKWGYGVKRKYGPDDYEPNGGFFSYTIINFPSLENPVVEQSHTISFDDIELHTYTYPKPGDYFQVIVPEGIEGSKRILITITELDLNNNQFLSLDRSDDKITETGFSYESPGSYDSYDAEKTYNFKICVDDTGDEPAGGNTAQYTIRIELVDKN